jgi:serine/threonine protein kinase
VDYWALGCLIYELFLARTPFQADYTTKIFQNIIAADKVLEFPAGMDPQHVSRYVQIVVRITISYP